MKNSEIAKVSGLSDATVLKILYLKDKSKYKFRQDTIDRVFRLKKINDLLTDKFKDRSFIVLCDTVIAKIRTRDSKHYKELIKFAILCKNLAELNSLNISKSKFYTPYNLLIDSRFSDLCLFAIKKNQNKNVRELALELSELSEVIRMKLKII